MRNPLVLPAALAAALALALPVFAADVEHRFQSTAPRGGVKRIVIDVPQGNFTLRTGAADTLSVAGVASRDWDTRKEMEWAQKVVNDTSVELYISGSDAIVRRRFGPNADSYRGRKFTGIDVRLDLPPGVDLKFETSAADVDIAGDFGHVDLDLRTGNVAIQMPRSRVRALDASCRVGEVNAHLGNQIVRREGLFAGNTHFFDPAGVANVKAHVTVGEINVTLTP